MFRHTLRLLCLAILLVVPFLGSAATPYAGKYPYTVTATTAMVGDIVRAVAGDKAKVATLMGGGVDPHTYKASRNDVVALSKSDVIFYSGLHLEGQMGDIFVKLGRSKPVYAVTELIDESELLTLDKAHDPHVWMDPSKWSKAAEAATKALQEFDPANAALYEANSKVYRAELEKLDAYASKTLATIPAERRVMITAHDAFSYLGKRYNLEVRGIQGLSTESEAGLQDINRLVDDLVKRKIPAVFVETSVSDKNVRALIEGANSRGHKVTIGGSLFSDAMGSAGTYEGTYVGMIDHNVTVITRALGGTAPERGMNGKLTPEPTRP